MKTSPFRQLERGRCCQCTSSTLCCCHLPARSRLASLHGDNVWTHWTRHCWLDWLGQWCKACLERGTDIAPPLLPSGSLIIIRERKKKHVSYFCRILIHVSLAYHSECPLWTRDLRAWVTLQEYKPCNCIFITSLVPPRPHTSSIEIIIWSLNSLWSTFGRSCFVISQGDQ